MVLQKNTYKFNTVMYKKINSSENRYIKRQHHYNVTRHSRIRTWRESYA